MSGRGTITSRATVSPNSIIDSMRSRSSSSMTSSFIAASTIPNNSCSFTKGPCSSPLPLTMTLVNEINQPDTILNGGNDTKSLVPRAVVKAARSGYNNAYVLGTASAKTKNTMTFSSTPTATPSGPKAREATTPVNVACTVWHTLTERSNGLTHFSGSPTNCCKARPCLTPPSAIAAAFGFVIRDNPISASERKIKKINRRTMTPTKAQSSPVKAATIDNIIRPLLDSE